MSRKVFHDDAFKWLANNERNDHTAIVTSLPDAEALDLDMDIYIDWLRQTAAILIEAARGMPIVFFQTDRKHDGVWVSKAAVLMEAAKLVPFTSMCWHKIVVRREPGKVDIHRPTYSHLMAFGFGVRPGKSTPDLIPKSETLYKEGMPMDAARVAARFCQSSGATTVLDPFCGWGTVLAAADEIGMDSIGVDIEIEKVRHAEVSTLPPKQEGML